MIFLMFGREVSRSKRPKERRLNAIATQICSLRWLWSPDFLSDKIPDQYGNKKSRTKGWCVMNRRLLAQTGPPAIQHDADKVIHGATKIGAAVV